ncbi:MAG: hypothetical protein PHP82_01510 [Candidatus ainarchaeum sp.]|nr:hypothetical protein [Candidatus ainarchaeum sp.]
MNKKIISIAIIILILLSILVGASISFLTNPVILDFGKGFLLEIEVAVLFVGDAIIVFILLIILIAINFKKNKKTSQKIEKTAFEEQRDLINQELKVAENQFLKNKIDKVNFDKISKEKNAKLIKLEAEIDSKNKNRFNSEEIKKLEEISKDKKNILKGLLEEKQKKIHELQIAEKSYYKRKIDEETFKKISFDIRNEMISIEGKIKSIQKSEEIEKIKKELKKGAKEIIMQKDKSEKRKSENEIFEYEVFEQIDKMVGGLKK